MNIAMNKSYYHSTSSVPLVAATTGDMLDLFARKTPHKEAYIFPVEKIRLTFADLHRQVNALATGFLCVGLKRGDTLGILSSCAPEYILVQMAAATIGVILARFHIALPNDKLKNSMLKSECVALVIGTTDGDVYKRLEQIIPDLKKSGSGILQTKELKLQQIITNVSAAQGRWKSIDQIMKLGDVDPEGGQKLLEETRKMVEFGDLYTVFYTSGTTGPSKGTLHTYLANHNVYIMSADRFGWTTDDILLSANPSLSHCNSEIAHIVPVILGMTSVIISPGANVRDTMTAIQDERCTVLFSGYRSLYNLLHHDNIDQYDYSSLHSILTGGTTLAPDFIKNISTLFQARVLIIYGSSETLCTSGRYVTLKEKEVIDTVGRPLGHTEVKIVNENGRMVPFNTLGELLIRSNFIFRSYIQDEEKTKKAKSIDGWYKPGDIAKINSNGYITIVGKTEDVIVKGGNTMYYAILLDYILSHPNVKAACIVPVPDDEFQEDFCACVCLIEEATSSSCDELKDFYIRNNDTYNCIPKHVMIFDDFPELPSGKIDQKSMSRDVFARLNLNEDWLEHRVQ
uniref:Acyl-CoA synthetase family member 2, mitochondrial-like n=1 Tax=Saccoglossus kowalevskii TaxID=10224 RepID=A0ABM0GSQ5_SACKO|nr:PREDICTED: acyl-CoA synthetase family member 2, mitochondrial-like [Saccoglossus kowalevskii]